MQFSDIKTRGDYRKYCEMVADKGLAITSDAECWDYYAPQSDNDHDTIAKFSYNVFQRGETDMWWIFRTDVLEIMEGIR